MKKIILHLIHLIIILFNLNVFSQIFVYDRETKTPIESVNIKFWTKGLISNEDGKFEIPQNKNIDTIHLSHLSYRPVDIISFNKNDTIYMEKNQVMLNEVFLTSFKAKDTLVKAIQKTKDNFINKPYNLFGFLRQTLQENSKGTEMVEVNFISYSKNKKQKYETKITNAKRTKNYSEYKVKTLGGALRIIEQGDIVKRNGGILDFQMIDNYTITYEGTIDYGKNKVYKLGFKSKNDTNGFHITGNLFLDKDSLSFIEISSQRNRINPDIKVFPKKPKYFITSSIGTVKYKKTTSGKMILSFIEIENNFEGRLGTDIKSYKLLGKLIINNTQTENAIPVKTNYNVSKDFSKAIKRYDKPKKWIDTYKLPLSTKEKLILKDISKKKKS